MQAFPRDIYGEDIIDIILSLIQTKSLVIEPLSVKMVAAVMMMPMMARIHVRAQLAGWALTAKWTSTSAHPSTLARMVGSVW